MNKNKNDSIPSNLGGGEFRIPDNVIAAIGNGDIETGRKIIQGYIDRPLSSDEQPK